MCVVGADREHPRRISWRGDTAVDLRPVGGPAEVARRSHHDDARVYRALGGERERIGVERLGHGRADRQVDDADVPAGFVGDGVVDRRDGRADRAVTLLVEHLERDDGRARRDAAVQAGGVEAVAGDDAGDVRTVTVVVVRACAVVDEVDGVGHAKAARTGPAQEREVVVAADTGVDDGDADARAVEAVTRAAGRQHGGTQTSRGHGLRDELAVFVHAQDGRIGGERIEVGVVDVHHVRVERLQVRAAEPAGARDDRRGIRVRPELDEHAGAAAPAGAVLQTTIELEAMAGSSTGRGRVKRSGHHERGRGVRGETPNHHGLALSAHAREDARW